ncbi:CKLF-like MARVEL transmembrane domain-containing protein 7 [Pelodytes ibericus]
MSHNVTVIRTTTSSSNVPQSDSGLLDRGYSRSYTGVIKLAQMLTLLIAFVCVRSSIWREHSAYYYFEVVTMGLMILILIFYLVNVFRIYRMLTCISWPLAELLHYGIGTFLLLIASIVVAVKSNGQSALLTGSVFGFIATFLCVLGMWLSYKVSFVSQSSGEFQYWGTLDCKSLECTCAHRSPSAIFQISISDTGCVSNAIRMPHSVPVVSATQMTLQQSKKSRRGW